MLLSRWIGKDVEAARSQISAGSAWAAVCDCCRLRRGRGSWELEYAGFWEGDGVHARCIEDRGGVVDALNHDGAALWAGCDNDARGVRAVRSSKYNALVGCGVGGKNIPSAKAHRGCGGYGVDVGHGLEWLRVVLECSVLRVLLRKCCGEMRECGWG